MKQGYAALSARQHLIQRSVNRIKKESKNHLSYGDDIDDQKTLLYMQSVKDILEELQEIIDIK